MRLILVNVVLVAGMLAWGDEDVPQEETAHDGVISGRVFDGATGMGLAGVRVYIEPEHEAQTDADGYYWLTGLAMSPHRVQCVAPPGYANPRRQQGDYVAPEADGQFSNFDFALVATLPISGSLIDEAGRAVAHADIRVAAGGPWIDTVSDGQGRFTIEGIMPGDDFTLHAWTPNLVNDFDIRYEASPTLQPFNIRMERAAKFSGRVLDSEGKPLTGARVKWTRFSRASNYSGASEITGANGAIAFEGLPSGEYALTIAPGDGGDDGRQLELPRFELAAGASLSGLEFVYAPDSDLRISGRILDTDGNPVVGMYLAAIGTEMQSHALTDKDGYYAVRDLAPGDYLLYYFELDGESYPYGRKDVPAGSTGVDFVIELKEKAPLEGPIRGRVIDALSQEPVESFQWVLKRGVYAEVDPQWRGPEGEQYVGFEHSIGASSWRSVQHLDGAFEMSTYSAGAHTVAVRAHGYADYLGRVDAGSDGVVIALEPESRLRGRVIGTRGQGIAGVKVLLGEADWYPSVGPSGNARAITDTEGYFELGGLSRGPTKLSTYHQDYAPSTIAIDPGPGKVTISLEPAGVLTGFVMLDGESVDDVSFWVTRSGSDEVIYAGNGRACMDESRRFRLDGLAAGPVNIKVVTDPYDRGTLPKRATVVEGIQIIGGRETEIVLKPE